MPWTVLIPAKALPEAKSRLVPASADLAMHRRLVQAIREDTLAAARAADGVARVLVVADRSDGQDDPDVVVQTAPGLNAALREAAAAAAGRWPHDGIAALVADLPALRPQELSAALRAAAGQARCFVPDQPGTGTTLLAVAPGEQLRPAFGPGSARRHGFDATLIAAGPGLRRDVDTAADLQAALALGVGPATSAIQTGTEVTVRSR